MRVLLYLAAMGTVMLLAFWAYRENYATQQAMDRQTTVQNEIAGLRENLGVLRAEWAYLNRPERLKALVNMNYERLRLVPVQPGQYVGAAHVDYPAEPPRDPAPEAGPETGAETGIDDMPGEPAPPGSAPRPPRKETSP